MVQANYDAPRMIDSTTLLREFTQIPQSQAQEVYGVTKCTNLVDLVANQQGDVCLEKKYTRKNGEIYAKTELDILQFLSEQQTNTHFPELASDELMRDENGAPMLLIRLEENYFPLSSDFTLTEQLTGGGPSEKLKKIFDSVYELHMLGIQHGDLHLRNIGQLPSVMGTSEDMMIIDFDLSKRDDYLTPDEMFEDLCKLSMELIYTVPDDNGRIDARRNIISTIQSVYSDVIDGRVVDQKLHEYEESSFFKEAV